MTIARAAVHDRLSTLSDPTRGRILVVLERSELTVGELCVALQLPQSTVSRHLRLLGDERWVRSRQEGTSRYYALAANLDESQERLWTVVGEALRSGASALADVERVADVLARRRETSREYFKTAAAEWDAVRSDLYGERSDLRALLDLLDPDLTVGDLGCGTGRLSVMLAPSVKQVVAVDASPAMLATAGARHAAHANIEWKRGELEALPLADGSLDVAVAALVLHYAADPLRVLVEAHRVVRPGGRILLIDLFPHDRAEYRQQMGHVWLGFSDEQVRAWLRDAGFDRTRVRRLPADPDARGPALFVASAQRPPGSTTTAFSHQT